MNEVKRMLLSGNEAIALAAHHAGVVLGTGYPGTPSTEILEAFSKLGGRAQWAPNEKVALEVGIGVAYGGARTLVTMKHVGVNVAADPLFTVAYTGVAGALLLISADDPEMHSSQNEQDNRNYSRAAGVMTLEPMDSQECYDLTLRGLKLSEEWKLPVILRPTTRVCHSKSIVEPMAEAWTPLPPCFEHDRPGRVMIPGNARPAHRRLREKLAKIKEWNETSDLNPVFEGEKALGIITSGVSYVHAREAFPDASFLKLGMTYPLPIEKIRAFASGVERCVVIEEGDPYLVECCRTAGIAVEGKPEMYRFGELNVTRVKRILAGDISPEAPVKRGKPPRLCDGCPHRATFALLGKRDCIVAGDIGCYTLSVLPPFEAMDSCVCMGASIGVGLGLRHALPPEEARRVVSVIGDSTFVHSGITGLVEMVYNPPPTGHVIVILDNGTTAMTGMQEHPGTGRTLDHKPTGRLVFEELARAVGVKNVFLTTKVSEFEKALDEALGNNETNLIIMRRLCALAKPKLEAYAQAAGQCNE
jgi:indolepyruvate ferredoxin oxidoreductase alpha subunit